MIEDNRTISEALSQITVSDVGHTVDALFMFAAFVALVLLVGAIFSAPKY